MARVLPLFLKFLPACSIIVHLTQYTYLLTDVIFKRFTATKLRYAMMWYWSVSFGTKSYSILNCYQDIQTVQCFHLFLMIQCSKKFCKCMKDFLVVVMCAEGNILLAGGLIYIPDQKKLVVE